MANILKFTYVKSGSRTGKTFELTESGELLKNDRNGLGVGGYRVVQCENIGDVKELIDSSTNKNIIILGTPDKEEGAIFCKDGIDTIGEYGHKIERNLRNFKYQNNSGLLLIDYDNDPNFSKYGDLGKEELLKIIYEVAPEIQNAPHMWKTSSSSNIYQITDGNGAKIYKEKSGIKGQHLFVHISDCRDIKKYSEELFKRFWLAGYGHISIAKSGALLERSVMDSAVNSPERLVFIKSNFIDNEFGSLKQRIDIECYNENKPALDISKIDSVSHEDSAKYISLVESAKLKLQSKSDKTRKTFVKNNYKKLGLNEKDLEYAVIHRKLFNDFKIMLYDGIEVDVKDILADKNKYDNRYCYEPMERDYGNGSQAFIDCYNGIIYSHAHGGIIYSINDEDKKEPEDLAFFISKISSYQKRYAKAAELVIEYGYIQVQIDQLCKFISENEKSKFSSVKATLKGFLTSEIKKKNIENKSCDSILPDYLRRPIENQFPDLKITSVGTVSKMNSIDNFTFMLDHYGIEMKYNEITKDIDIFFPDNYLSEDDPDMRENSIREVLSHMLDINELNIEKNITKAILVSKVNKYNPPLDWIKSIEWDGVDRIGSVLDRIVEDMTIFEDDTKNNKFIKSYKKNVIISWFIQAVSALDGCQSTPLKNDPVNRAEAKYEFVLDFVSPQGLKKTKFIRSLLPKEFSKYIKTGVVLDIKDKDSLMNATKCWICEFGELEETIKVNSSGVFKGFLSQTTDSYRVPFGKSIDNYRRTTVFVGTVNNNSHLEDPTGNRRFLVLSIKDIIPFDIELDGERIDIQQLWSQFWDMYLKGYQWWPDSNEFEKMIEIVSKSYTKLTEIDELIEEFVKVKYNDLWRKSNAHVENKKDTDNNVTPIGEAVIFEPMKTSEILTMMGVEKSSVNRELLMDKLRGFGFSYSAKRTCKFGMLRGKNKPVKCFLLPIQEGKKPVEINLFG